MKVAIPLEGDKISFHFGRCYQFAFFEIENNKVLNKEIVDAPPHQEGVFPQFLKDKGVELVIVSGIGRKALEILSQLNIKVIQGIEGKVEETIKKFLEGELKGERNLCEERKEEMMPWGDGRGPRGQGAPRGGRFGGNRPGAGPQGFCVCPNCGTKIAHQRGIPCYTVSCPKCGMKMVRA